MDTIEMVRSARSDEMAVGPRRATGRLRRRVPAFAVDWSLVLLAGLVAALPGGLLAGDAAAGSLLYSWGTRCAGWPFLVVVPAYWLPRWRGRGSRATAVEDYDGP